MELELKRIGRQQLDEVRPILLSVFAEVYANRMDDPFFTVERFNERLTGHAGRNEWEAVIGYVSGEPVGYAYGAALQPGARWWMHQLDPLSEAFTEETGARTLALFEIMTREQWRGTGVAHRIHEELLASRAEERVTLLVDPRKTDVKSMYERWGYASVGEQKPFPDSPLYATMVRQLRAPTAA